MPDFYKRSFDVRAAQDIPGRITGKPIVFNSRTNLGYIDEIIEPGALDNADLSDVRFLVNHDVNKIPLARARATDPDSTMRLSVTSDGMDIVVDLDIENNADARALYSAVKRGDISGMSFMFSIDGFRWENLQSDHPTRRITAIGAVAEVSAVTFPAYESTEISARDYKSALEEARRAAGDVSCETSHNDDLELEKLKAKYLYNI